MAEADADEFHRHLQAVLASGAKQGCDLALQTRSDGKMRVLPVHIDSVAFADGEGHRTGCRSVVIDLSDLRRVEEGLRTSQAQILTQRKQAARDIRESELRFRQMAERIEDVFVLTERDGRRVAYVSPAFETIWGRPVADLYRSGSGWIEWVHGEDRDRVVQAYESMLVGGSFDEQFQIRRPDGEVRWVRARAFPIKDEGGNVGRDVWLVQDITSERELEEELRQAQKMEAVGALASGVAHDFNNTLQAALGCLSVARHEATPAERARMYLDRAAAALRRGGDLANELMLFARKQTAAPKPIAFDPSITRSVKLIERLMTEQISVNVKARAPDKAIFADEVQIEQILMNLAANARDAMPEGGTLSIRTDTIGSGDIAKRHWLGKADCYVRLVVQDSGTGMDARTRARIFEPFFTTKEVGKGTGLGLSTVFALTRQLGGHIDVDSELGKGTTFTLYFPCIEQAVQPSSKGARETTRLTGTALLVEDERLVRLTVRHYLEELGLEVLEAAEPDEAQQVCERHRGSVDLLVSDIVLPIMRGPKLAALLKQRYPTLRVLFISANPDFLADGDTEISGAPVLQKPFGKEELADRLLKLPIS